MRLVALGLVLAFIIGCAPGPVTSNSHLGVGPENIVTLQWRCNVGTPTRILSNGEQVSNFEIPSGDALVITDLEWRAQAIAGSTAQNYLVEVHLAGATGPVTFPYLGIVQLAHSRGYLSDHLTSGIVVDSSVALNNDLATPTPRLSLFGVALGDGELLHCNAVLRGYLASP